jgi:orotidine-5'-phosphate decarboxylase
LTTAASTFADQIAVAVSSRRSQLVLGLDPMPEFFPTGFAELPASEACARLCRGIIDAAGDEAVAVKPQLAFFEALGADGIGALEEVCAYARDAGLLVLADAKRSDAVVSSLYATAFLEGDNGHALADAMTVNPYMGRESVEPFLDSARRTGAGIFVLLRNSNPGSAEIQEAPLANGRPLWHHVASLIKEWGSDLLGTTGQSNVGAVVGATNPGVIAQARRLLPDNPFLILGVGTQGAPPSETAAAFATSPAGGLVSVSRAIMYASREQRTVDWQTAAAAAAREFRKAIWAVATDYSD